MDCPDKTLRRLAYLYSDSGMNENPTAEVLADTARASGNSFRELINKEPELQCYYIQQKEVPNQN